MYVCVSYLIPFAFQTIWKWQKGFFFQNTIHISNDGLKCMMKCMLILHASGAQSTITFIVCFCHFNMIIHWTITTFYKRKNECVFRDFTPLSLIQRNYWSLLMKRNYWIVIIFIHNIYSLTEQSNLTICTVSFTIKNGRYERQKY